jgi:hypothetical protein
MVAEVYAEAVLEKAIEVMRKIGQDGAIDANR